MVVLVLAALVVVLAGGMIKQLYKKKKLNKELHGPIHKMRFKSNLNFSNRFSCHSSDLPVVNIIDMLTVCDNSNCRALKSLTYR